MLDETWSYGVLGRHGQGVTAHQNVDPTTVDMIVGSLAGPLCAGGGFCAGTAEVIEHQRISSLSYTYSAALPAMLATTASETITLLQTTNGECITQCREHIKAMWAQLDPRSDWVWCSSAPENPMILLMLKPEVVATKKLGVEDQEVLFQDVVDEVNKKLLHLSLADREWLNNLYCAVLGERCLDIQAERYAPRCQRKRLWVRSPTCSQALCNYRINEEGG